MINRIQVYKDVKIFATALHKSVETGQIWQKLNNKNNKNKNKKNNNIKVFLKIAYALHARDQKFSQEKTLWRKSKKNN